MTDGAPGDEPTTVVSLTFDDIRADEYRVGAMVAARRMRATFRVNSAGIRNDGFDRSGNAATSAPVTVNIGGGQ